MEEIRMFIERFNFEIIISLMAAMIILLLLYIISQVRISKIRKKYNELARGKEGVNFEELLLNLGKEIDKIYIENDIVQEKLASVEEKQKTSIQKVGFIRYNAFAEMGNELSYSIALMDNYENGFVISSIYGREFTTSYAKPIKNGKSTYELSVEEVQAVNRALLGQEEEKDYRRRKK